MSTDDIHIDFGNDPRKTRPYVKLVQDGKQLFGARLDLFSRPSLDRYVDEAGTALPGLGDGELKRLHEQLADRVTERAANTDQLAGDQRPPSGATRLVEMALPQVELFRDPERRVYADVQIEGHRETVEVRTNRFEAWLGSLFYEAENRAPSKQTIKDALAVLEGKALYESPEHQTFVRVAARDGDVYIDLGNNEWDTVKVTPGGWRFEICPPVRFRRATAMHPLPRPTRGSSVDDLRAFLNTPNERSFRLTLVWLVAALRGRQPFAILVLQGAPGCAKSTYSSVDGQNRPVVDG